MFSHEIRLEFHDHVVEDIKRAWIERPILSPRCYHADKVLASGMSKSLLYGESHAAGKRGFGSHFFLCKNIKPCSFE